MPGGHQERLKDFLGYCRATGAVIEAAILASRLDQYSPQATREAMHAYAQIIEKTGGENEKAAFLLVQKYIRRTIDHD